MPTKVRKRIAHARLMFQRGSTRKEVIAELREMFSVSYDAARRTANLVEAEEVKALNKTRGAMVARQSAKLNLAQRVAMAQRRPFVKWIEEENDDGTVVDARAEVHYEADPDLSAFIGAVEKQNRLLGLNAPERREVVMGSVANVLEDMAELLFEFIPDTGRRAQFLGALQRRVQARLASKPELEAIIDADVVTSPPPSTSNLIENPRTNKHEQNGSAGDPGSNGHG